MALNFFVSVNIGYKNLQKPLARALYLLELHDLALEEGQIHVDNQYLIEVRSHQYGPCL